FLDQVLSAWSGGEPSGDATVDQFIADMQRHAEKLGWIDMMDRLRAAGAGAEHAPHDSSRNAVLLHLARGVLDGELGIDQAEHIVTALSLADDARAVLCLYVSCNPALIQEGIHAAAMRLAADTAGDSELAARIYWTLGRSGGSDPSRALQAFSAALKRIGGEDFPALQARLCLDFARCCSQIGRPDEAIEAARVATVFAGSAA